MKKRPNASDDPEILARLKALQPSTLYLITSKAFFLRGFRYYQEERLKSLSWDSKKTRLNSTVVGSLPYTVTFFKYGAGLRYACDCPAWSAEFQCKHVICTLLTIINLISPKLYYQAHGNKERLRVLRSSLLGREKALIEEEIVSVPLEEDHSALTGLKNGQPYQVVVETINEYPAIYLRRGGRVIDSGIGLPRGLSIFTYRYFSDRSLLERFVGHLAKFGNRYPLVLVSGSGEIPIEWDPKLNYLSKTELNVSGVNVDIRSLCILDGRPSEKVYRFWDFVVDLNTRKFGRVKKTEGWRLYTEIDQFFRPASIMEEDDLEDNWQLQRKWIVPNLHFQIPLKIFQSFQLNFTKETSEEILNALVLKIDDRIVTPAESQHRYRLTVTPDEEGGVCLEAQCRTGSLKGVTTSSTFSFFTAINEPRLPSPLKALKRQHILCDTFFNLILSPKKGEAALTIRKALSNNAFTQYSVKSVARDLLKKYFSAYIENDLRLWGGSEGWFIATNKKQQEARLYQIPFECFGPKLFKEMRSYYEMRLPAKRFYEQLPVLHERFKEIDIDLYYHGKPVKNVKWDFSFEADRISGIDWLEIKPEIRCNGVLVDESVWLDLLQHKGIVEKEGAIHIVDSNAQKILKSLSLIYRRTESENRTKKEIVQIPNLQILDWVALRKEGVRIKLSNKDEALIRRLTTFESIEKITVPRHLQTKLRPYQKEGLDWLAFLYEHRFGACLADDMGLGKTIQAISLLAAIKENIVLPSDRDRTMPHLIVVPPTLLFNWEHEIERFYPDLKVYQYAGKDRKIDFKGLDVVLTTYPLVRRDIAKLKDIAFHVIIFDEAQAVKNLYADTTGAVRLLQGLFKLVMTGTPLENHLGEYYSLIDLCLPGLLGNYDLFKSQIKREDRTMLSILIGRTRPFVLRRVKKAILNELPPKVETDIYLELTARQKRLYQRTVASIKSQINDAYRNKTEAQAKIIALTAILKLRQLCVSTRLIAKDADQHTLHSPKMKFLVEQLGELLQEGHSALVFSQFTSGLDLFEEDLKQAGIPFIRLDGSTPTQRRKRLVERFQEGTDASVFLLSLKAGGQGLNLTKASYVFHLDPWWNPAVENQASDRAHRIGQKNKVSITRILMRYTIEEKMMFLKKKKLALYKTVMEGAEKKGRACAISRSDFDFLLGN